MPETPEKPKVKVACSVPNGLAIRLFKVGYDDGTGDNVKPMIGDGAGVRLNGPSALHTGAGNTSPTDLEPGITEVDAEWWGKWLAQNQQNPFVAERFVYEFKEEAKAEAPNPL